MWIKKPREARAVVVGGGTMGIDVAVVLARGGAQVVVVEPSAQRRATLPQLLVERLGALDLLDRTAQVTFTAALGDLAWASVSLVIDCVPERLDIKRALFAELVELAEHDAVLTSNSSSFPISTIAEGLATADRMFGLHFFMPAHLVPLVEVVMGPASNLSTAQELVEFMRGCGNVPVLVRKDKPGFLANRMQHAMAREAFALIDEGVATPEDVDAAVRFGFGFRFLAAGPVMQRDHAGLDIHCAAAATMYPSLANNSEPARALRDRVSQGHLGMKSGEGFYAWTPETQRAERDRYDRLLHQGLSLLAAELPQIERVEPAKPGFFETPLLITVAPNGAYKQTKDHPALPVTPETLAQTAKACMDAGAAMLHMHIRDAQGGHSLDVAGYREATRVVRAAVGSGLILQVTSEAANRYQAAQQIAMVKALIPEAVSVGLREIDRPEIGERGLAEFFAWLVAHKVMTQVILYDESDLQRWQALRQAGVIPEGKWSLLFVLGRYTAGQRSEPKDLLPFVTHHHTNEPWAMCAFGSGEHACATAAAALGGHVRVGFENNLLLKSGVVARDNAALVHQVVQVAAALGRPVATADQARGWFAA
jgi:3-hydroxybutyryl-CoA dehydrogenase